MFGELFQKCEFKRDYQYDWVEKEESVMKEET